MASPVEPHPFESQVTAHQLRILKTVADSGGFSRAAEAMHLSQPAISHQMKTLAAAVGTPLVEISGRRLRLTAAGSLLYAHAARILAEFESAGTQLDELRGLRRGLIRIAGDTTVGIYVLPDVLGTFKDAHPDLDVRLDVGNRQAVQARLADRSVDFAVVGRPWPQLPGPFTVRPFLDNELVAVAAPRHPLATAAHVSRAELAAQRFILREPGSGTRETTEEALRDAGPPIRAVMELASNGAIKRAVARGLGVSVVSRYAAALELELGLLIELRVDGFPLRRKWHLIQPRADRLGAAERAFITFIDRGEWRSHLRQPLSTD